MGIVRKVPCVVKDCLGKSKLAGFGLFYHENSYDILKQDACWV